MALTAAQINTIYTNVLQRPASAAEQAAWVALDTSGTLTDVQVINDIVTSPEAQTDVWPVVRLYQAAFGRVPDQAGLTANVDFLDPASGGHGTELQLAAAFVASAEFTARYGAISPTASLSSDGATGTIFLQALYNNVLGRTGQPSEIAAWLATGESAAQVLIGFSDSAEFQAKVNPIVQQLLTDDSGVNGNVGIYTGSLLAVLANGTTPTFTLTPGADSFVGGLGNNVYSAPVFFNAPSGTFFDTLNSGDQIQTTGSNNILNVQLGVTSTGISVPGNNVIVNGVQTWNVTNTSGLGVVIDGVGATTNITGLTTLTVGNSTAGGNFQLGGLGAGNGIGSLVSTVTLTNDQNVVGVVVAAGSLPVGSAITLNVNADGSSALDEFFVISPDSGLTTTGYATWNIGTTGTNFLEVDANNFSGDRTLNVSGSGSTQIDSLGNVAFGKTTTVSLANETGTVFITGLDAGAYTAHGGGAGIGVLAGNTVLASYTGGSGNDIVDLSSLSTAALQAMTTLNGGTGTTETAILGNGVTEAAASPTNVITPLTNFQSIGLAAGHGGTVVMANFPGANTLTDFGNGTGNQIVNASGLSTFTFNTNGFVELALTINGPTTGNNILNVQLGGNGFFETAAANSQLVQLIDNNYSTANISSIGPVSGANVLFGNSQAELFTAPVGQSMAVNISGTDALNTNGFQLFGNGTSITDTDTGVLNIDDFIGGVAGAFSTNVANLNASASGGLSLEGGDSNTVGTAGDIITGSLTKANILVGSVGNDQLTVGTAGGDQIWTNGGGDVIGLGVHTKTDTVFLAAETGNGSFNGALTTLLGGQVVVAGGIDNAGVTQAGFFGNAPGTTGLAANTSFDMSTVSNFVAGTPATADTVVFSKGEWLAGGTYDGLVGVTLAAAPVAVGTSVFAVAINGATVTSTVGDVLVLGGGATFANATAMETALASGSFAVTLTLGATTAAHTADLLVAYQDTAGNTRIADVNVTEVAAAAVTEALAGHVNGASDMVQITGVALSAFVANNVHFIA